MVENKTNNWVTISVRVSPKMDDALREYMEKIEEPNRSSTVRHLMRLFLSRMGYYRKTGVALDLENSAMESVIKDEDWEEEGGLDEAVHTEGE